jgi:hypothetical protein
MIFRTEITPEKFSHSIQHNDQIVLIGSCFTENIGVKLIENGFQTDINPFGIIYNPITISECLRHICDNKPLTKDDILESNGWFSYYHHGIYKGKTPEELLKKINNRINESNLFIKKSKYLILTLGTSWIYTHNQSNKIMGNCHKLPSKHLTKSLLSIEKIVEDLSIGIDKYLQSSEVLDAKVLITISPIRHFRDGYRENQVSKSLLHIATEQLLKKNPRIEYFPSYEIMMDDLRDYRYYNADMQHPNSVAIDYIWEKFQHTYFNQDTISRCKDYEKLKKMKEHRPFEPESQEYQTHLQKIKELEKELNNPIK